MELMNDSQSANRNYDGQQDASLIESADEITEAAQLYFAHDFPNPDRTDCPSGEALQTLAHSRRLPGVELRSHLLTCSECFQEYRKALALRGRRVLDHAGARRSALAFRPRVALAFGTAIVLVALSALVVIALREGAPDSAPIAGREHEGVSSSDGQGKSDGKRIEQPARGIPENGSSRPEKIPPNKNLTQQLALNYREVDLESYARYRGKGSANKAIQLKTSLNQLLFRLPDGSPVGRYRVTIKNSRMDQTLANVQMTVSDGKTLKATFDLRKLEAGEYVLCISPEAQAPFCYDVVIAH